MLSFFYYFAVIMGNSKKLVWQLILRGCNTLKGRMSFITLILIVINAAVALSEDAPEDFRLPKTVVPFHYKLKILTKLSDDFAYNGKV